MYYTFVRFTDVIFERTYDTVTEYSPLDFTKDTRLAVGQFFETAQLKIYFQINNDTSPDNCTKYTEATGYFDLESANP